MRTSIAICYLVWGLLRGIGSGVPPGPDAAQVFDCGDYYKDYRSKFPQLVGPALGFTVGGTTQDVRILLSGLFEACPKLKVILGYLGEGLPFLLGRIDETLSRPGNLGGSFREHFYLTTSRNLSTNVLVCSMMEMGADQITVSVDWPLSISPDNKAKIFGGNARRFLRL